MSTPTFFDLPAAPSDPCTPSDMGPGTPNSGTTSISALSTTAIKDGHRGHTSRPHHHHQSSTSSNSSTNTLDAERADRISRLAGLERVATARQPPRSAAARAYPSGYLGPGATAGPFGGTGTTQPTASPLSATTSTQPAAGYFDPAGNFVLHIKDRSTVGSASATGSASVGATAAWAETEPDDGDKMSVSEDQEVERENEQEQDRDPDHEDNVSSAGLSDNASLVGFGETATSTMSGPISAAPTPAGRVGWGASRASAVAGRSSEAADAMQGVEGARARNRAHASLTGKETTERIVREREREAGDMGSAMEE